MSNERSEKAKKIRNLFRQVQLGDRVWLGGLVNAEVTVVRVLTDYDRDGWHRDGRPKMSNEEWLERYSYTWAFEVSSGHYLKLHDPIEWLEHVRFISAEERAQ